MQSVISQTANICFRVKLCRLLRYLKVRDMKSTVSQTAYAGFQVKFALVAKIHEVHGHKICCLTNC